MSILSIGAIIAIGGILAITTTILTAATGTTAVLLQNNQNRKIDIPQINEISNISYQEQQKLLQQTLNNLRNIVQENQMNIELKNERDKVINKIENLNKVLQNPISNYDKINQEATELVEEINELIIRNQSINYQKQEIINQIKKYQNKIKNVEEIKNVEQIIKNPHNFHTKDIENLLNKIEDAYISYELEIKVTKSEAENKKRELTLQKIRENLLKIKEIDLETYQKVIHKYENLENLDESYLKILYDQSQLDFSNLQTKKIRTDIYKIQLELLKHNIDNILKTVEKDAELKEFYPKTLKIFQNIDDLIKQKFIEKEEFEKLRLKFIEVYNSILKKIEYLQTQKLLQKNIKETLEKIGYQIIDSLLIEKLTKGEIIYIDIPYSDEYKVQLRLTEDNQIYFRLVKFTDSLTPTSYEKQKDLEIAQKWCKDYDKILELLKENGIIIENIKRIEPEETEITYILKEEKKKQQEQQKYMQIE